VGILNVLQLNRKLAHFIGKRCKSTIGISRTSYLKGGVQGQPVGFHGMLLIMLMKSVFPGVTGYFADLDRNLFNRCCGR
jgi:hypothetical protein